MIEQTINTFKNTDSSVKAGDLILSEEPFAYTLSSTENGNRCDYCLQKCKVRKCSGCQFVHYCGKSCQRAAWDDHKWECANIKKVAPKVIPDAARLLVKIINRLKYGDGTSYKVFYTRTSFRMWKDLMSHYSDLKKDKKRMEHFTSLCGVLYDFLNDISLPNTVDLMGLYGRMVINSFTILDNDLNSIGSAVYIAASIIDHSCNPNAVATFDGRKIIVRALVDMPKFDWKKIRISYIELMKTPFDRQKELLQSYYFVCQCEKCLNIEQLKYVHAAKCFNQECDNPVNVHWQKNCRLVIVEKCEKIRRIHESILNGENNYDEELEDGNGDIQNGDGNTIENGVASDIANRVNESVGEINCDDKNVNKSVVCSKCGTKYPDESIEVFKEIMSCSETILLDMKNTSVAYMEICKCCIQKQKGVLHPLNVFYAQILEQCFDAFVNVQLWQKACVYAEALLPCFRFYYGPLHPLLGLLHLKYGKILLYKMDLKSALQQLKSAEKILKITHGDTHPLYKEQLLPLLHQAFIETS
ncbi:histone-lysine N-methyltransferase SMYD3 [Pieris napi]|uniref:histone-lysine N-methyltransferase SMYD3 n=1 Tax=Pieris napi TaxID=78633 RepID=UPI001FBBD8BE|nr:histone-lysine N-methyltransferase SMYD3 [Pieris napi]XP_047525761.1 histone-lysine N-methyltransferase SMYD3 [Pieris napi]